MGEILYILEGRINRAYWFWGRFKDDAGALKWVTLVGHLILQDVAFGIEQETLIINVNFFWNNKHKVIDNSFIHDASLHNIPLNFPPLPAMLALLMSKTNP